MVNLKLHKLITTCRDRIKILQKNKFLIAYSGGIDSSVLLDCFAKLSTMIPIEVRAIHINHGISKESEKFQNHCEKVCNSYHVSYITQNLNLKITSIVEEECRKERYNKITEHCLGDEVIVTAHHEEDQIETFFLRLMRGSGARGLSCMKENSFYNNTLYIRWRAAMF